MRHISKSAFFIVVALIAVFTVLTFCGVSTYYGDIETVHIKGTDDIRWGIDISGGVEAVFSPDKDDVKITDDDMASAKSISSACPSSDMSLKSINI